MTISRSLAPTRKNRNTARGRAFFLILKQAPNKWAALILFDSVKRVLPAYMHVVEALDVSPKGR